MRKPENENTFCRFRVFAFSSSRVFPISVRFLIAGAIIDCSVFLLSAKTAFLLCAFSGFRVFAFSPFSRFRVPPAAPPRPGHRFRMHSSKLVPFNIVCYPGRTRWDSHFGTPVWRWPAATSSMRKSMQNVAVTSFVPRRRLKRSA